MKNFDVIIVGAGPGGYVAAIRAARLGQKTALIEKDDLGGICLNWGCIPTKSLLESAKLYQKIKHSKEYGLSVTGVSYDIEKIISRSRNISKKLVGGIESLLKKNKVTVFKGTAKLVTSRKIIVNDELELQSKKIIISTGARAKTLRGFEPNNKNIWNYRDALIPKTLPKSMIIVGSGAIGIEFASFYNDFGVNVTVLEAADTILPAEDKEISNIAQKIFESKGIKFTRNVSLISQRSSSKKITVEFKYSNSTHNIEAEILLMAVGVVPNIENIGLENTSVNIENGYIVSNKMMQTNDPDIYAIGDVTGAPCLAHKASHQGIIAAESISGQKVHFINKNNIPSCVYSNPQIASIGLTEDQAINLGYKIKIGRFPFYANAKALVLGSGDGTIKTIFDQQTGEMLGAHMIGADVTELISSYAIHKEMEGTELDLFNTNFPHPTLSEMIQESAFTAYKKNIHT